MRKLEMAKEFETALNIQKKQNSWISERGRKMAVV
jgi:hypothetical protein